MRQLSEEELELTGKPSKLFADCESITHHFLYFFRLVSPGDRAE